MTQVSVTVTRCEDTSDEFHYLLSEGSGPIRIGRSPANHVKVDFRGISAYHLEIRAGFDGPECGLVRACDLSMNGTSLELPGGEKKSLQKGIETSIPDGTKLTVPGKFKKAEGQSEIRRSYVVRWHRVQSNGDTTQDHEETPAVPVKVTETGPEMVSSNPELEESERTRVPKAPNGSTPPPSDVPVPVPEAQSNGVAEASSPTHSDSADSPVVQPPVHADANFSVPAGAQLRPKAQPKRPAAFAQAQKAAADDASSSDKEQKTSKKVAQKSRSRDGSGDKGGQSKSRGRGRGRQRKRSETGSGSNSRSRKRRRRRKRSKSRGGKRKRKRSKSRSSSSESKSDDNDDKASSTAAAGNPMAMQQSWGMHWGAQSAWGWNPYMQGNAQPQMNVDMIKQQIYFMYQRFKPEKLPEYENILKKYKGSEYELLQAMCSKYMGSGANAAGPAGGAAK